MAKSKFDPNAAFKNIVGVTEETEQENQRAETPQAVDTTAGQQGTVIVVKEREKEREEIRSKRVNLVIKPSVYNMAKAKCVRLNISLNECLNQFLEQWSKE